MPGIEKTAETTNSVETNTESLDAVAASQDNDATNTNEEAEVNNEEFEDAYKNDADASKKQSSEENAKFAKERREREQTQKIAKEKEQEAKHIQELEKVRLEAIKETLGGVNPYTNAKIEDKYDMEEYLLQKEMEKEGLDPIQDFSSYMKRKQREDAIKRTEEIEKQTKKEWIQNDRKEFFEKYPDVKLQELNNDDLFKRLLNGKIGNVPMASIYEDYLAIKESVKKEANETAARVVANKAASPGTLKDNGESEAEFTIEDIKKMSQEEVYKNYDKIIKVLTKK